MTRVQGSNGEACKTFMWEPNIKKRQNIFKTKMLNLRVKYILVLLIKHFRFIPHKKICLNFLTFYQKIEVFFF